MNDGPIFTDTEVRAAENRPRYPGELCHVCASPNVEYWHTIHSVKMPFAMVNIGYCERCAKLLDKFEQDLFKWIEGADQ